MFRRLIYGPGWWLLYLPTKLIVRFVTTVLNISIGSFAALIGASKVSNQSTTLSQVSERVQTSLIVKPSAKGGFPRFGGEMPTMSIAAGGGGTGAKSPPSFQDDQGTREGERILDKVGEMAEDGRNQAQESTKRLSETRPREERTVLRERIEGELPNPKKRMFEEPRIVENQNERIRDEL